MGELRKIVVCGATGKQGGAVLDALLESGQWNVVAISRDTHSQKADEIKKKGVPVLQADLASKASLVNAFKGASCHSAPNALSEMDNGEIRPLLGGLEIEIPPATIRAINLTPDKETGIGNLTDGQIARAVRYGIGHDGRMMMPVMEYSQMSDDDLTAIISYLRSQSAQKNEVKKSENTFLGKALLAFGVLKPKAISEQPVSVVSAVSAEDPVAYGKYLATGVANCLGCHTHLDVFSGEFTVPPFSGGFYFEPDALTEGYGFVSPNLTPDTETGIIAHWTEEVFLNRFKSGRVHKTSPMPWGAFAQMDTSEMKAIFQYLQSLDAVNNPIGPTVYLPGEKPAK